MTKRARPQRTEEEEELGANAATDIVIDGSSGDDICQALLDRYAKSSAPQHRHLCASACAMRSILTEEGLPLTSPAYFAAVIRAIRDADREDRDAMAALSSFLSVLLPVLPTRSIPQVKAKDAAFTVMSLLESGQEVMMATSVRSLVKSLGFLVVCLDFGDWSAVELPLQTLFKYSMDRRPKVRRCAQLSIEDSFTAFDGAAVRKKASKFVLSLFKKYISLCTSKESRKKSAPKSDHMEALYLLNIVRHIGPKISHNIIIKLLPYLIKLLGSQFSLFTRHTLSLLEVLVEQLEADIFASEAEKVTLALESYISSNKKNPADTILSASTLLGNVLNKLHTIKPDICMRTLLSIFNSLAGFLVHKADTAKCAADLLIKLTSCHVNANLFPADKSRLGGNPTEFPESKAVDSICILLENMLVACNDIPNEHLLAVISEFYLRLGELSYFFMKTVTLKLSHWAEQMKDSGDVNHLQECLGCAVSAMGPEKMLSLLPISLNEENMTCSNTWLLPILRKYVSGASLLFFVEQIMPLADSLRSISKKVKKSACVKGLQSCINGLWDLLPAFCHYPIDTSNYFDSLAKHLVVALKDDSSILEAVASALQVLVNENKNMLGTIQHDRSARRSEDSAAADLNVNCGNSHQYYPRNIASKNIKCIAASSLELLQTLIDIFFCSPADKRSSLKGAIECLASIIENSDVKMLCLASLDNIEFDNPASDSEDLTGHFQNDKKSKAGRTSSKKDRSEKNWCLAMELASCFVIGAENDLINKIFGHIGRFLLAKDRRCHDEAYSTLSKILKEHAWVSYEKMDELTDLLIGKPSTEISALRCRFSCMQFLLLNLLKREEEKEKEAAFLILNEIILTLKDSDKEVRKSAYDLLIGISCIFKGTQSSYTESPLDKLLSMILGYLSGSSPQIMSGAVAALSLLIYKDPDLCLSVQSLIPSVLVLLQKKAKEVVKAVLGFFKVLVSCLHANDLNKFLPDIANGVLPWSSISKNHFRSKVRIIFEIMIRKCGARSVNKVIPDKYRAFIKTIEDQRQSKASSKGESSSEALTVAADLPFQQEKKRKMAFVSDEQQFQSLSKHPKEKKHKKNNSVVIREPSQMSLSEKKRLNQSDNSTALPSRNKYSNRSFRSGETLKLKRTKAQGKHTRGRPTSPRFKRQRGNG